ncbi:MAG TPA: family 43 glycosylhydrolase [Acidimicrobiia bacterium]|nr:family 43 glycosylhydrolase [Acidimicrobiia bacterium]
MAVVALGMLGALTSGAGADDRVDATASTSAWFKPGVPFTWQFPDPSVYRVGRFTWAASTNQGGAHVPVMWSTQANVWTARANYAPNPYNSDPWMNDALTGFVGAWPQTVNGHSWVRYEMWAPSIARIGSAYVAYLAVRVEMDPYRFCIFAATSVSPAGPFATVADPLVCRGVNEPSGQDSMTNPAGYIDPDVFVDANGAAYLLFKSEGGPNGNYPKLWSQRLSASGTSVTGAATLLLTRNASPAGGTGNWEGNIVENPSMVRYRGRYFLVYSANLWSTAAYATGYAVCSGPQGPCTRPSSSPLLRSGARAGTGPGGGDVYVDERGRLKLAYHAWRCGGGAGAVCGDGRTNRRTLRQAWFEWDGSRLWARGFGNTWGSGPDSLWTFDADARPTVHEIAASRTYTPVAGDFRDDARDEILWYGTAGAADAIATFDDDLTMHLSGVDQPASFLPIAGDFDADGDDDVYWYAPGPRALEGRSDAQPEDEFWLSNAMNLGPRHVSRAQDSYASPIAGDFTGDGATDLWWTTPGGAAEELWDLEPSLSGIDVRVVPKGNVVTSDATPLVGDFDGDRIDDIFWYGRGALGDSRWTFDATGRATATSEQVRGEYEPFVGDFDGNGVDDIFWYGPGAGTDYLWRFQPGGAAQAAKVAATGHATPIVGDFDGNGVDDIFWYS